MLRPDQMNKQPSPGEESQMTDVDSDRRARARQDGQSYITWFTDYPATHVRAGEWVEVIPLAEARANLLAAVTEVRNGLLAQAAEHRREAEGRWNIGALEVAETLEAFAADLDKSVLSDYGIVGKSVTSVTPEEVPCGATSDEPMRCALPHCHDGKHRAASKEW